MRIAKKIFYFCVSVMVVVSGSCFAADDAIKNENRTKSVLLAKYNGLTKKKHADFVLPNDIPANSPEHLDALMNYNAELSGEIEAETILLQCGKKEEKKEKKETGFVDEIIDEVHKDNKKKISGVVSSIIWFVPSTLFGIACDVTKPVVKVTKGVATSVFKLALGWTILLSGATSGLKVYVNATTEWPQQLKTILAAGNSAGVSLEKKSRLNPSSLLISEWAANLPSDCPPVYSPAFFFTPNVNLNPWNRFKLLCVAYPLVGSIISGAVVWVGAKSTYDSLFADPKKSCSLVVEEAPAKDKKK